MAMVRGNGLLALFGLLWAQAVFAAPLFPRGGSVGLEPPDGMSMSDTFLGFQKGRASILITELPPVAYAQIDAKRAAFAAKVQAKTADDVAIGGVRGFIVRGRQSENGLTYRKWAVVLGAAAVTALVTVQVPTGDTEVSDAAVETALRSIVLRASPDKDEQVAALPFTVGDDAGFRKVRTLMGAGLILTEGPKDEDPNIEQPSVIVATSLDRPAPATGREAFAKAYLRSVTALDVGEIDSARVFDAAGAQWAEVRGTATRGKGHVPVDVVLIIRFGAGDFIATVGTVPKGRAGYAERFRQLALSIKPRG